MSYVAFAKIAGVEYAMHCCHIFFPQNVVELMRSGSVCSGIKVQRLDADDFDEIERIGNA